MGFGTHGRTSHAFPGITLCQPALVSWLSRAGRPYTLAVGALAVGCLGVLLFLDLLRSDVLRCLDVLRSDVLRCIDVRRSVNGRDVQCSAQAAVHWREISAKYDAVCF